MACSDKAVLGALLLGDQSTTRAALWYRTSMQKNSAAVSLKPDGHEYAAFLAFVKSQNFSNASKRGSHLADSDVHPEITEFLKDVAVHLRNLDPSTEMSATFTKVSSLVEVIPNDRLNNVYTTITAILNGMPPADRLNKDKLMTEFRANNAAFLEYAANATTVVDDDGGNSLLVTLKNKIEKTQGPVADLYSNDSFRQFCRTYSLIFMNNLKNSVRSIASQFGNKNSAEILKILKKNIPSEDIQKNLTNSIRQTLNSTFATDHTSLKKNSEQRKLYDFLHKSWANMKDCHKEFVESMIVFMKLENDVWTQVNSNFGDVNVGTDDLANYRINLKRNAGLPVFHDSIPYLISTGPSDAKASEYLRNTFKKAYLGDSTKSSGRKNFSLKNDNEMFRALLEDTRKNCEKIMSKVNDDDMDLTTQYKRVNGKLYKLSGDQFVPYDLEVANLSEDEKCHSLGIGIGSPHCNSILHCFLNGSLQDLSPCTSILGNKDVFRSIQTNIDFVHPTLVGKTLERFEFAPKKIFNSLKLSEKNSGIEWGYESVDEWLEGIKKKLDKKKFNLINDNKHFLAYMKMFVKFANANPVACSKNSERDQKRTSSLKKSDFAVQNKVDWFVSRPNPQVSFYRLKQPFFNKPILRPSEASVRVILPSSYSPFAGMPPIARKFLGQFGGDKSEFDGTTVSQMLYNSYKQEVRKMKSFNKSIPDEVNNKVISTLKKMAPLDRAVRRAILDIQLYNTIAEWFRDYNEEVIDEKKLQDILVAHSKYLASYNRKTGRIGSVLGKMASTILNLESRGKIPANPEENTKLKVGLF